MLSPRAKQLTCALAIPILPGTNPRTEGHNFSSHLHSIITQLSYMVPTEFSSADEWAAKSSCTCHKKLRKWYTQQEELKPHSQWNETGIKAKYCMMQLIWGALYRQVIRSWWKTCMGSNHERCAAGLGWWQGSSHEAQSCNHTQCHCIQLFKHS